MAIVRWRNRARLTPWDAFADMDAEFNRMFRGFGSRESSRESSRECSQERQWLPAMDVSETDDAYIVEADVPGISKEDIAIEVVGNVVTIKGERKHEAGEEEKGYRRVERNYGSFERSFKVPDGFNAEAIEAKFENGVLSVTLPKREETKPRAIKITAN